MNTFLPPASPLPSPLPVLVDLQVPPILPPRLSCTLRFDSRVGVRHGPGVHQLCQGHYLFTFRNLYCPSITAFDYLLPPRLFISLQAIHQAPARHPGRYSLLLLCDIVRPPHVVFSCAASVSGLSIQSNFLRKWTAQPSPNAQVRC